MSGIFLTSNLVSFRILFGGFYFGIKEQMWFVFVTVYVLYCISHEMSDDMGSYIRAMNDEIKQLESKLNMLKTATHIPANLDALSMKQRYYLYIYIPPFFLFIFRSMFFDMIFCSIIIIHLQNYCDVRAVFFCKATDICKSKSIEMLKL